MPSEKKFIAATQAQTSYTSTVAPSIEIATQNDGIHDDTKHYSIQEVKVHRVVYKLK